MKRILILCAIVSCIVFTSNLAHADSPKDYAGWWEENYGAVTARDDPLTARAEKVFKRVATTADKKGNRLPKLLVIKGKGNPYAQTIKDGTVILTQGALVICYKGVTLEKGDSRVAFVLGHELAHLAKDDFWHALAFAAVKEYDEDNKVKESLMKQMKWDSSDPKTQEFIKTQELQADSNGLIYMTMAGYDPKAVIDNDNTNFIEEWVSQITGEVAYSDATHPAPAERAAFVKAAMAPVIEALDYFTFGVRLYQISRHWDAILFFNKFREKYPGREVLSNLGLSYYQLAMRVLSGCDPSLLVRFKLPVLLDTDTYGMKLRGVTMVPKGYVGASKVPQCLTDGDFIRYMSDAVYYLKLASDMDPAYLPAKINLSTALIMAGEYSDAKSAAEKAQRIEPDNADALNNEAVALYLFGEDNNVDTTDNALGIFKELSVKHPSFSAALYNLATIQAERKRTVAAEDTRRAFLNLENTGIYADTVRKELGISIADKRLPEKVSEMTSPFPIGQMKAAAISRLKDVVSHKFTVGDLAGEIYVLDNLRILVLDDSVELVEKALDSPVVLEDFKKLHGEPVKTVETASGATLIYGNLAVDVVDEKVVRMAYFYTEGIR